MSSLSTSKSTSRAILVCLGLLLGLPAVLSAATLTLVEESSGHFRIDGAELADVAALDLSLSYDSATLRIDEVTAGALLQAMLFAENAGTRGSVKISAAGTSAVSGAGVLAQLTGAVLRDPVGISGFSARLYNAAGRELPVETRIELLPATTNASPEAASDISEQSAGGTHVARVTLGGGEEEPAPRDPPPAELPPPRPIAEEPKGAREPIALSSERADKKLVDIVSVRKRFAAFTGRRTLAEMGPLFHTDPEILQQAPEVVLTDGVTPLELVIRADSPRMLGVALKSARLLHAGFLDDGRFRVRCIPFPGAASASLVLLEEGRILSIPLAVAPPVGLPTDLPPQDLPLPRLDLDGDGAHSRQDDYLLVANLLAQGQLNAKPSRTGSPSGSPAVAALR